ncbi:hypothetical protein RF11_03642 [Thelohanellus kitauei]|uniref:Uncharacterized protein n=1 Tax=Thelohanellus kitauei TaxID=669202 RepID=A0A0C2N7W7_THEKT|nr:hypothetical protein RF11_03642 [Thelohanellus kitauei]
MCTSWLKNLCGVCDELPSRPLYSNTISYANLTGQLIVASNVTPRLDDHNNAIYRRLRKITFFIKFTKSPVGQFERLILPSLCNAFKTHSKVKIELMSIINNNYCRMILQDNLLYHPDTNYRTFKDISQLFKTEDIHSFLDEKIKYSKGDFIIGDSLINAIHPDMEQ